MGFLWLDSVNRHNFECVRARGRGVVADIVRSRSSCIRWLRKGPGSREGGGSWARVPSEA